MLGCDYLLGCNSKCAKHDDWHLNASLDDVALKVLCCPEDAQCVLLERNEHGKHECCDQCVAPVCRECSSHLYASKPQLPPSALANDMMIFYPPFSLYKEKVTMMEMICASVCVCV